MKQIKFLLLFACLGFFGAVNAQTTITYTATYRWTGGAGNSSWINPANWQIVNHNSPTAPPDFPNVISEDVLDEEEVPPVVVGVLTPVHNVIIPFIQGLNPNHYPSLQLAPVGSINLNDIEIQSGATLTLAGRSLVINGALSGTGLMTGSTASNLSFDGLNKINVKMTQAEVDAFFPATPLSYFNNFELFFGEEEGFSNIVNGRTLNATAPDGTVFFIETPTAVPGVTNIQMSTFAEFDPIDFSFDAADAPVYSFSAKISVTDDDFTPTFIGRQMVPPNGTVSAPTDLVETNEVQVLVTLTDGTTFTYTGNAAGDFVGFTTQIPIETVTVTSNVLLTGERGPVGFVTVDDVKFGGRLPVGTLNMAQTNNSSRTLNSLTVNVVEATSGIGGLTMGSPVSIRTSIDPQSGVINSSPTEGVRNLTLLSSITGTANVLAHTATGTINGTVNVQRFIGSEDFNGPRIKQWRFLGFPYSEAIPVGNLSGITVSYATPTLMDFNESRTSLLANNTIRNAGYQSFTGPLEVLGTFKGLAAWIHDNSVTTDLNANQTLTSFGPLNESGAGVTVPILFSQREPIPGWNLISNPYASTINWNLLTRTGVEGTVYRWDPQAANWTSYNGTVGVGGADQFIESGSSFFVKATTAINATLAFPQAAKVEGEASSLNQFKKNGTKLDLVQQAAGSTAAKVKSAGIRINASGPGNPIPSQAYLDLSQSEASEGFDAKYDARNMGRTSGAGVAIQAADQLELVMQYDRPIAEAGKEKRYYPLKVTVPAAGKTKLDLELEGNWNSLNTVYLIDKKEGKTVPLSGNKLSYDFNMVNTVENDRFILAVNHVNVANKSGIVATDVRVMNNPVRSDVIDAIIAHPSAKAKSYSIVNGSGATLNRGSIQDNNSVQHQLGFGKSNANGVMYLRVDFENGDSKTVKFIKL